MNNFYKKKQYIKYAAVIVIFVICGCVYFFQTNNKKGEMTCSDIVSDKTADTEFEGENITNDTSENKDEYIYVYICGEVEKSGVYTVSDGTRIYELVEMAGGFTADADDTVINLADKVVDGQKIYFPSVQENKEVTGDLDNSVKDGKVLININTANIDQLMTLPGIGESKAKDIITYRQEKGSFKKIEDIKNISGIKDAAFNKIKDYISV